MTQVLRQRFFRHGAADATVAIFKRMDGDEIQMRDSSSRDRGQGCYASGSRSIEPFDKVIHLPWNRGRGRRLKMDDGPVHTPGNHLHRFFVPSIAAHVL